MTRAPDPMAPRDRPPVPTHVASVLPERLQGYLARGQAATAQPFKGVTTDGSVVPNLFARAPSGVSNAAVIEAAHRFLASLPDAQRAEARLPMDNSELWRSWCNIHPFLLRHGVCMEDMGAEQRAAAMALLQAGLGAQGFKIARDLMALNDHLRELTGRPAEYGPHYYWLSVFGEPAPDGVWGWQIDGHHLIINAVYCGDQLVLTPNFLGSEPVRALSGAHAGVRVFEDEEEGGLKLIRALPEDQRRAAIIGDKPPHDVFGSAFCDNVVIPDLGVRFSQLDEPLRQQMSRLIDIYLARLPNDHARLKRREVDSHLAATRFAWMGGHDDVAPFYYRIYSPVILLEFCHQPGQALGDDEPSRNHIHTLMRTPNGGDYGFALRGA